jgi:cardiolipin synthase A/B
MRQKRIEGSNPSLSALAVSLEVARPFLFADNGGGARSGPPARTSVSRDRLTAGSSHRHKVPYVPEKQNLADRFRAFETRGTPGGTSSGNHVRLFSDGDQAYAVAHRDIESAVKTVWVETYLLEPDEVGNEFMRSLMAAAQRGCDVRLLYDRWGSPNISEDHAEKLCQAGVKVAMYNPFLPNKKLGRKIGSLVHRDHRKIMITDGAGYAGGRNISTDYGGPGPDVFFDVTLRLEGPGTRDLASIFIDAWNDATGESLDLPPASESFGDGIEVDVLELNRKKNHHDLDRTIHNVLRNARSQCLLVTPYFVPPKWFLSELIAATERGVDVRLLTAGKSDVPFAKVAGRHLYGRLLKRGMRIFEMSEPTLHAKLLVVDGCYALVGSYNVDRYGAKHNLELGVGMRDEAIADEVRAIFDRCLESSKEVTIDGWKRQGPVKRIGQWMAYGLASI